MPFRPWYQGRSPDHIAPRARLCTPGGFPAYEHRWALAEAFDLHLSLGKRRISHRIAELDAYCRTRLAELSRVRVRTPADARLTSGMVCFDVPGADPARVVEALLDHGAIAGQTPYRSSAIRLSPGILNSADDIDRAVEALATTVAATAP